MMRQTRKKRYVTVLGLIVLIILLTVFVHLYFDKTDEAEHNRYSNEDKIIEYNGVRYKKKNDVTAFLIIGLDKYSTEGGGDESYYNDERADFIMLSVFDNEKKVCHSVNINRDTVTEMNVLGVAGQKVGTIKKQLALSHTYGNSGEVSCRNVEDAVSDLLAGVKIDHYISLTMDAIPILNDIVGGVEVTITDDFSSVEPSFEMGKTILLSGEKALVYVRSRQGVGESDNLSRLRRQREYLNALFTKIMKTDSLNIDYNEKLLELDGKIVSDCTISRIQSFIEEYSEYEYESIFTLDGITEIKNELMEFYPSDQSLVEAKIRLFYESTE